METIRSTLSSNSSQPCSRTSTLRVVGTFASFAMAYSCWRQPDDVDVELLQRPLHAAAPAATDVEQGHAGLEVELAEGQVELGVLGLVGGHVVAFVISAGVAHRGAEEELEELVGDVVDRLQFLVLRLQRTHIVSNPRFNHAKCAPI